MLTSPRKIYKLFIKFTTWNKYSKAENLLKMYPEYIMPWQKAFEEAARNKSYSACNWLFITSKTLGILINIHYNNDELILDVFRNGYLDSASMICSWDKEYPWLILLENRIITMKRNDEIIKLLS